MNTKTKTLIAVILILLITIAMLIFGSKRKENDFNQADEKLTEMDGETDLQIIKKQNAQESVSSVSVVSIDAEFIGFDGEKMMVKIGENETKLALNRNLIMRGNGGNGSDFKKGQKLLLEIDASDSTIISIVVK